METPVAEGARMVAPDRRRARGVRTISRAARACRPVARRATKGTVDAADHYAQLARLGLGAFVSSAAPAALVRRRPGGEPVLDPDEGPSVDLESETMVGPVVGLRRREAPVEIFPLSKKAGAPFPDMITIGRTPNNDIVLRDATVSRLHAFFRQREQLWIVADAGSKNGSRLDGAQLEPRKERPVTSGQRVRIGDLELTFYTATDLFHVLAP